MSRKYGILYKSVCSQVTVSLALYRSISFFFLFSHPILGIKSTGHGKAREVIFKKNFLSSDNIFVPGTVKRMWVWVQAGPTSFKKISRAIIFCTLPVV